MYQVETPNRFRRRGLSAVCKYNGSDSGDPDGQVSADDDRFSAGAETGIEPRRRSEIKFVVAEPT